MFWLKGIRYMKKKSLTEGKVLPGILTFMLPVFFGMLFQQLYNMVDTAIVGRYLGINALGGVGSTGCICFLVIGTVNGICSGFTIPVSQSYGAKDFNMLKKCIASSIVLSVILGTVITLCTCFFCKNILIMMDTPEENFEFAYEYIFIIFAGIPFTFLYNLTSGFLRSIGDSRSPLYFLLLSSVLNIVLDLLFILVFHTSVDGAAYATVISQAVSGLACLLFIVKKYEILRISKKDFKAQLSIYIRLLSVGIPMGVQYGITAIGTIFIQTAINSFGPVTVAGVVAAGKIGNLVTCPLEALGASMATFAGQNVGAGKLSRVKEGLIKASLTGMAFSVVILGIVFFFGKYIAFLFLKPEEVEPLAIAQHFILISASCYILLTLVLTVRFTIQGMGYSTLAIIAGFLEMVARCVIALTLPQKYGFDSICFASPVAWLAADLFLIPAFIWCFKKASLHYSKAFHTESL